MYFPDLTLNHLNSFLYDCQIVFYPHPLTWITKKSSENYNIEFIFRLLFPILSFCTLIKFLPFFLLFIILTVYTSINLINIIFIWSSLFICSIYIFFVKMDPFIVLCVPLSCTPIDPVRRDDRTLVPVVFPWFLL